MIRRHIHALAKATPNIGRGLIPMGFNALVFYLLNRGGNQHALVTYTWFLITAYFLITLTGWGVKDYMLKEYSQKMDRHDIVFTSFLRSKIPLVLLVFIISLCVSASGIEMLLLFLFVMARTGLALTEPLILLNRRTGAVFCIEAAMYVVTSFIVLSGVFPAKKILLVVTGVELARALAAFTIVRPQTSGRDGQSALSVLYSTKYYFFIALFSFCMSRIDAFILGFYKHDNSFAHYNILLTLITACQIVISAIYNQTVKSVFRAGFAQARAALDKVTGQFLILSLIGTTGVCVILTYLYQVSLPAIYFALIPLNLFCFCLTVKYLFILNHINRSSLFLAATILSSVINVVASLVLIPLYGMPGALISNTAAAIILVLFIKFSLWLHAGAYLKQ